MVPLKESARAGRNEEQVTALSGRRWSRVTDMEAHQHSASGHSRKHIGDALQERRTFVARASRNSSVGSTYCTSSSAARLIAHNLMILGSTTSITYKRDCMSTWATNQNYCIGTSLIRATALHLFATGQSFKIPGCLTQMRSSACLQNKCHG